MALSHRQPKPVIFGIFEVNPAKLLGVQQEQDAVRKAFTDCWLWIQSLVLSNLVNFVSFPNLHTPSICLSIDYCKCCVFVGQSIVRHVRCSVVV